MAALGARLLAKEMSQEDVAKMDAGPKETWPPELWQKLGFSPPSEKPE